MQKIKIGILKEGKIPVDRRVPLTPLQTIQVIEDFKVDVQTQKSLVRCFADEEYLRNGIELVENLENCDFLLGVKEVPINELIPNKTYLFFSHTIKEQPYNRKLLQEIVKRNITLIDYEKLTDENGLRLIAFGRWAGIVGAYNGIWAYGKRFNLFDLRRSHECNDLEDLKSEFAKVELPSAKIVLVGTGRVASGAMEILDGMKIRRVTPEDFISTSFDEAIYTQLSVHDYVGSKDGSQFREEDFFENPEKFKSHFLKNTSKADLLITAFYWDPRAPVLFEREEMLNPDFNIKVIADITCDIEGSVPSTKKASTIDEPLYDYNPNLDKVEPAISNEENVTVMAVDNLPCELPKDASNSFGRQLIENILPSLLGNDDKGIIKRATITKDGALTEEFSYLQKYIDG